MPSRVALAVSLALLICLSLCSSGGAATAVWQGVTEGGWRGCVVRVNIDGGTSVDLAGAVDLGGVPSPKIAMDQETSPSMVGSIHVGLEFGGQEKPQGADCSALVEDEGAQVTGVRILSEDTGGDLQPAPIHVTPNPAVVQVFTSTVKNLAKVHIYNASLFLEDSGPGSLEPKGGGVFSGPVTARVVTGTVGVTSPLPVVPPMQAPLPDEGDERLLFTADQELTVMRVFSSGGVELRVEMPSVSYETSTSYNGVGVEATLTARLLLSSADACEAPLQRSLADGACGCPEGLTGASCSVCAATAGCGATEVCDASFEYAESTSTKGLTCQAAPGSGLEGILSVLELQCSPSGPLPSQLSALADPNAGFCGMQVGLNIGVPINLECHAYNCSMAVGSSDTNCSAAVCSCPDGCNGMDMIAQTIQSAAMLCDAATGSCSLEIAGLPDAFNSFEVLCGAGECLGGPPGAPVVPDEAAPRAPDREISTSASASSGSSPLLPGLAVVVSDPDALEGCDGVKVWDMSTQSCVCPSGLSGSTCGVCSTDASCGVPGATCDASYNFTSSTATKAFVCSSTNPAISAAVEQVDFQCSTNADAPPPLLSNASGLDGSLSFCDVQVRVALGPRPIDVECAAYNCAIPLNESSVSCGAVLCDCVGDDCATFESLVDSISDVAVGCSGSGDCSITIGGLPFSNLAVECGAGECVAPGASGNFTGSRGAASEPDWHRIGIAVVGFLPTAVMAVLLLFVFLLARASQTCGRASAADDALGTPFASKRIKALSFEGLTVTVPQQRTAKPGRGKKNQQQQQQQQQQLPSAGPVGEASEDERELEIMEGQPVSEAVMPPQGREADASTGQLLPHGFGGAPDGAAADDSTLGANSSYGEVAIQPMPDEPHYEGKKCILSRVSCTAVRGEVLAIMGPSGSGKTTLLSILAAREGDLGSGARVKGSVLVDGAKRRQRNFRSACAYVAQDDALFPSLTVRESVYYSAKLRMPERSLADLDRLTDETLSELRLSHVANVRVGSSASGSGGRGVSGGERRRVSIAMEMVTQPSIIMLDEPTSGLDSFAAGALMGSLRDIAQGGRVVVLTLHQPSPNAFYQLDKVLLLARGRRVFSGSPLEVEEFFSAPNFPVEHGMPIADHMLQVVSDPSSLARALAMTERSSNKAGALSPLQGGSMDESCKDMSTASAAASNNKSPGAFDRVVGWLLEMDMLLWRGFTNLYRTPTLLLLHSIVALLMGLGMGVVYLGVDDSLTGLQNKAGGIFFALAFFAFCSLTTVDTFLTERTTVLREIQGGYYSAASYLLVKVMLDSLLLRVLPAVLFSFPFYFLMGLSTEPPRIAVWFAVLSTFSATAGALSLAVSIGCRTAGTANLVMTMVLLISLVFGGFLANLEDMPPWVSWISYGSIFRYSFNALVVNEVIGGSFDLSVSGYDIDGMDSELLLDVLGLNKDHFSRDVAILDILFVGFLMIAVLVLYLILPRHGRRRSRGSKKADEAKKAAAATGDNGQQDVAADDRPVHILADESVELSVLDP